MHRAAHTLPFAQRRMTRVSMGSAPYCSTRHETVATSASKSAYEASIWLRIAFISVRMFALASVSCVGLLRSALSFAWRRKSSRNAFFRSRFAAIAADAWDVAHGMSVPARIASTIPQIKSDMHHIVGGRK